MKITLFTSSEARHIALAEALADVADELCVCTEVRTFFSGEVDDFFQKSDIMAKYFSHVNRAQETVFGHPRPFPKKAHVMAMKLGDLTKVPTEWLGPFLDSDLFVVFGASFIRNPLISFLVKKRAINIHMGISPLYRGNSCNFWAAYDGRADLIGATIHELTAGLDSGPMLAHTLPSPIAADPFLVGMLAVKSAQDGLVNHIRTGEILLLPTIQQDKTLEIRYTRNADFNDEVAKKYLQNIPTPDEVLEQMKKRDVSALHSPYISDVSAFL